MTNIDSVLKNRDITLLTEIHKIKAMVFPMFMYSCGSWTVKKAERQKNSCLQTVVLEKTPESPLDCMEIKSVTSKENQPSVLIGKTDAEAEVPILWPPDGKRQIIGKYPDAWKD